MWPDSQYWTDDKDNAKGQIVKLIEEFTETLKVVGMDREKVLQE